jgi:AraC-like DNA-binding protein
MGGSVTAWSILAVAVMVLLASSAVGLVVLHRRQRRLFAALLKRLDELEARWQATGPPGGPGGGVQEAGVDTETDEERGFSRTGDVLAGLTTHVQRIVQGSGGARSLADQAIVAVHRRIRENVNPAQIAGDLFVSQRTLERGLAASLDCSPSQLILAMKMREAKRLLTDGQWRVNEVAEHLAFANAFHFSRRFKSFYRVAPSSLRRQAS